MSLGETSINGDDRMKSESTPKQQVHMGPVRQTSKKEKDIPSTVHQDDTMGQLKRTFAGIFGEVQ